MGPEFYAVRKVIHDSQKCHIILDLIRIIQLGIIHLETLVNLSLNTYGAVGFEAVALDVGGVELDPTS